MTADQQYRCYHRRDDGTLCELRREDHDQPGADHAVEAAETVCVVCGECADDGPIASNGDPWCGECYREAVSQS